VEVNDDQVTITVVYECLVQERRPACISRDKAVQMEWVWPATMQLCSLPRVDRRFGRRAIGNSNHSTRLASKHNPTWACAPIVCIKGTETACYARD
jgi:hypothetical protein